MSVREAAAPALTEERARAILRPVSTYLAENLNHHCSCNACYVCAARFLVNLQGPLTGPTIIVTGWNAGMQKIKTGKALHEAGLSLVDSHRTINHILESFRRNQTDDNVFDQGEPIRIQVAEGIDRDVLISQLREFGIKVE